MKHVRLIAKNRPATAATSDPMSKVIYQSSDTGLYVTPSTLIDNFLYMFSPMLKWG